MFLTPFASVILPQHATDRPRLAPRPGESLTAATFRQLDRFHGSGLSATDQTVVVSEHCAVLGEQLDAVLRLNADMQHDRDSLRAIICQLRKALTDAHELIAVLQDQLDAARVDVVSAADAAADQAVAWALHVEAH